MCKSLKDIKKEYNKFKIENITVTRAQLLKVYYWESLNIEGFNEKSLSNDQNIEHNFYFPTHLMSNAHLKIVFWLRNCSSNTLELNLKRIKNCECKPMQTRVGFNQFRQLYHCPHRRLIYITQDNIRMEPGDLVAMSIITYFFLYGYHKITYQMSSSDSRVVLLHFHLENNSFKPLKCVLTKQLQAVKVSKYRRFVQPLWVCNETMQNIKFDFSSRERGLRLLNTNLTVPRQSVWPLMVEYRPNGFENTLTIDLTFDNRMEQLNLKALGVMEEVVEESNVPIDDYECADYLYVIYPNKLDFNVEMGEERSLMVHVHNYNQKCIEFVWQNYLIKEMFEVTFKPERFRLKPHHSKLCVVKLQVFCRPLYFTRIPTVLEVHQVFDKPTRIARELLTEIESIDNPVWAQDSYLEHVFLHLNIKVKMREAEKAQIDFTGMEEIQKEPQTFKCDKTTIFEKFFWEYLANSNFMRDHKKNPPNEHRTYEEVLNQTCQFSKNQSISSNRFTILEALSELLAEGLQDISKNWKFVPIDMYYI